MNKEKIALMSQSIDQIIVGARKLMLLCDTHEHEPVDTYGADGGPAISPAFFCLNMAYNVWSMIHGQQNAPVGTMLNSFFAMRPVTTGENNTDPEIPPEQTKEQSKDE